MGVLCSPPLIEENRACQFSAILHCTILMSTTESPFAKGFSFSWIIGVYWWNETLKRKTPGCTGVGHKNSVKWSHGHKTSARCHALYYFIRCLICSYTNNFVHNRFQCLASSLLPRSSTLLAYSWAAVLGPSPILHQLSCTLPSTSSTSLGVCPHILRSPFS